MVLQVSSGDLFVQLQPKQLRRYHDTAEDVITQFRNGTAASAPGPAAAWGIARCDLVGFQLQTPEPQVTLQELHGFGLSSTFLSNFCR